MRTATDKATVWVVDLTQSPPKQTAVDPATRRLFVSGLANGEVRVFDSVSGAQVGSITHPDLLWGLGICIRH